MCLNSSGWVANSIDPDQMTYDIYPKYWDILSIHHTCLKIWNSAFYYLLMCLKYYCMYGKQCRPWSDAAFCGIWSGSTLFAKAYHSQYLGLLWYTASDLGSTLFAKAYHSQYLGLLWYTASDLGSTLFAKAYHSQYLGLLWYTASDLGSTLFAKAYLSQYLGLLWYTASDLGSTQFAHMFY